MGISANHQSKTMADKENRYPENAPGRFYVDDACIHCDQCGDSAPHFFRESDDSDHYLVYRQPTEPGDIEQVMEALDDCPVGAIGDDGDA